jgi:predicted nucleic acid-binding protein
MPTSGNEIRRMAWDSCVFLAWLQNEQEKPLADIRELLRDVSEKKVVLVVSAVVVAEVLDRAGESDAGTQFRDYAKRSNILRANVDFRIAERAALIRERAIKALKEQRIEKSIKAPDALIVATSLIYKADILHTFDPVLLSLDEHPVVEGLKISEPSSGFADLPLFPPENR